ncbi:Uncharacterised protein [Escherichia coli]|nr:Uncharacterised protein [Escherichia coli]
MEHTEELEDVKCLGCGKKFTNDELIQENGVSIDSHVNEVKEELSKDIQKQFNDILKKAFKGSKNIRIK